MFIVALGEGVLAFRVQLQVDFRMRGGRASMLRQQITFKSQSSNFTTTTASICTGPINPEGSGSLGPANGP
jgi:hypothetical protein